MDRHGSSADPATAAEISILSAISYIEYEGPDQLQSYSIAPPESGYSPTSGRHSWSWSLEDETPDAGCEPVSDPPGIGVWPRRLLYIPTWTSYEWKPGNVYGVHREPKYRAISYTWGRFRLDQEFGSKSKALRRIRGIPISNCRRKIPRIDPKRFSCEELKTALIRTTESAVPNAAAEADFVWLDVACIDQNRKSEIGRLEVGRQAGIFGGAQLVTIWLNDFTRELLNYNFTTIRQTLGVLREIDDTDVASEQIAKDRDENLEKARNALDAICKVPWFSSLWTLQEAFLCPKAQFMSRDGHFCQGLVDDPGPATLEQLSSIAQCLRMVVRRFLQTVGDRFELPWAKRCWEIEELIGQKGFPALDSKNPMILYAAAGKRTAEFDFDYVYGIQQVFGFRLGNTRPGFTKQNYSRAQLQARMGAALIEKYPVESQMHVFNMPVENGQGWSISLSSRLPEGPGWEDLRTLLEHEISPCCELRAKEHPEGGAVGYFQGKACEFVEFDDAKFVRDGSIKSTPQSDTSFMIGLDTIRETEGETPEYRTWGRSRDIPGGRRQKELSSWLVARYLQEDFIVLRLGSAEGQVLTSKQNIGLLLLSTDYGTSMLKSWKRIGFVIWDDPHGQNIKDWRDVRGFFG